MRYLQRSLCELLVAGPAPESMGMSLAAGFVLGVFPALGWTMFLCAGAAWAFRLNLPAIQLVNYLAYPVQLALLIPVIGWGERLFGTPPVTVSMASIMGMIQTDVAQAINVRWWTTARAIVAWMLVSPVAGLVIYRLTLSPLRLLAGRAF